MSSLFAKLHHTSVQEIPGATQVLSLSSATSIDEAIQHLIKQHYSSAPVYDSENKAWLGFFDLNDMIQCIVDTLHRTSDPSNGVSIDPHADLRDILAAAEKTLPGGVGSLATISINNPFHAVHESTTLLELLNLLGKKGIQRVPVVEKGSSTLIKIVTQSALAKYFIEHPDFVEFLKEATFESTRVGLKEVHVVSADAPTLRALETILKFKINAVGVVDPETSDLLTTFTAGDIRILSAKTKFKFFGSTVLDVIQQSRQQLDLPHSRPALIALKPSDTLWDALTKMAHSKIHRIFLVNADHHAVGVVTFKDILHYIYTHANSSQ